ncbi:hypothetical protein DL93DRAFT_2062225, partial [Clavulina sp. PMI_390]
MIGNRTLAESLAYIYAKATGLHRIDAKAKRIGKYLAHLARPKVRPVVAATKYKPVDKKNNPIPVSIPPMQREPYKDLPIPEIPPFPTHPPDWYDFAYTPKLTKERLELIVSNIEENFLSQEEISLLVWVLAQNEKAIAFDDSERGTFKPEYFPDYIMETVPHVPWQDPIMKVHKALKAEVVDLLRKQKDSGNLENAETSYRASVFVIKKASG